MIHYEIPFSEIRAACKKKWLQKIQKQKYLAIERVVIVVDIHE